MMKILIKSGIVFTTSLLLLASCQSADTDCGCRAVSILIDTKKTYPDRTFIAEIVRQTGIVVQPNMCKLIQLPNNDRYVLINLNEDSLLVGKSVIVSGKELSTHESEKTCGALLHVEKLCYE